MVLLQRREKTPPNDAPVGAGLVSIMLFVGILVSAAPFLTIRVDEPGFELSMKMGAWGVSSSSGTFYASSGFSSTTLDHLQSLGIGFEGRFLLILPWVGIISWRLGRRGLLVSAGVATLVVGWLAVMRALVERQLDRLPSEALRVAHVEWSFWYWVSIALFLAAASVGAFNYVRTAKATDP